MKAEQVKQLRKLLDYHKKQELTYITISVKELLDLLETAEWANKAAYILESLPVDMDEMLDDYDPDEDY